MAATVNDIYPDGTSGPALLRDAGIALYGDRWTTELSRDLGVAARTVRRWAAGNFVVPAGVWDDIRRLLRSHGLALAAVRQKIPNRRRAASA